ncbi:MAG: iron transporter [Rhodospirillales bacterium]|jgi:NRAMP (natural resistance-associated macrophage protein)-like metal ion transporter|nr:iron transporter [Rhodospirillales bacterium]
MTQAPKESDDPELGNERDVAATVGSSKPRLLGLLGPGLITGASDDDPSGIATYSQAGAQFGFGISWAMLFSYPLMSVTQEIAARIGRATGHGVAGILARHYPAWLLQGCVGLLLFANVVNLGADLGAMADATTLLMPGPRWLYVILFGTVCILAQIFMQYARYVSLLKWSTLALFAYFATLGFVHIPWGEALHGFLVPSLPGGMDAVTVLIAVLGTTISPYLFFWQSSQEAEDQRVVPRRRPLVRAPSQSAAALERIRIDTYVGMGFSNLVAVAIMLTTAATLHQHGITEVATSAQAAEALRPLAGDFAFALFALGIIATGLLAVPILAGSAAYAIGESRRWPVGLARAPREARAFYGTLTAATLLGVALNFAPIDPIRALFWSAVINGVTVAPVMAVMMLVASRRDLMGPATIGVTMKAIGWLATLVMTAASLVTIAGWIA